MESVLCLVVLDRLVRIAHVEFVDTWHIGGSDAIFGCWAGDDVVGGERGCQLMISVGASPACGDRPDRCDHSASLDSC